MEVYKDSEGRYHRVDGPAVIWPSGTQEWRINGKLHRENGPAVIYVDGMLEWYINNGRHREDGPAVIHADGSQEWWLNGKRHRDNDLPCKLNKNNNTMTMGDGSIVPMSANDYEKYRYKPTGRFTKAALRDN